MTDGKEPIRLAIIGTSSRSDYMYGPIVQALGDEVELVAVWGRSAQSARRLGARLGVPSYTNLEELVRMTAPRIGIVSVAYGANGEAALMAVEQGLNILCETPIAHKLSEADAIIAEAHRKGVKVEVAEQFHRRPVEQLKLALLASGLFGRVYSSFNDFAGHGYHGVSVMRSYLGFDARPVQVTGAVRKYELMPHGPQYDLAQGPRNETQEHGIIEFEGGQLGFYHWTDIAYHSALRWWRSSRFLAEKGMGISVGTALDSTEHITLLDAGGESPRPVAIERRLERCDGGALVEMLAHTGDADTPTVIWENLFRPKQKGQGVQWHDDEIGVAGCLMSLVNAVRDDTQPTYGPEQARLDQEIVLAIRQSSLDGGRPITLPLDPSTQQA